MGEQTQRQQIDWAAIRRAYELTDETIKDICQRFGITKSVFEGRWRKERWLSRQAANRDRHSSTRDRLFAVLERQVAKLANESGETLGDKEAQQLTELVKNFDKLGSTRSDVPEDGGPAQKKDMRDLRDKLAKRLEQFDRR
jgi:transposase-like protein